MHPGWAWGVAVEGWHATSSGGEAVTSDTIPNAGKPSLAHVRPEDLAERRQVTVMFCDLVGSTELSTRLDPEDLQAVERAYQTACADVVARFHGFIAQYLGDGVMVYFGYPESHEHDAIRAVRAGLSIIDSVDQSVVHGTVLRVRIGIATGLTVVGDPLGSGSSSHPGITGLAPNLAARMQALAPPGGLVIADSTYRLLREGFTCKDLGPQVVKGIAEPTRARQVLREATDVERAASMQSHFTPFVGRDREIGLLLDRWREATGGSTGQAVSITGEAGIGKTRLVYRLIDQLEGGGRVVLFQGSEQRRDSPFHPIITEIRRSAGFVPEDSNDSKLDKIEALLGHTGHREGGPLLASLLLVPFGGRYPPLSMPSGEQRRMTINLLVGHVLGLAAERPVVLIVEDVHWLDPSTEEVLSLLMEKVSQHRLMIVMTTRPDHNSRLLSHPSMTNLTLGRLDTGEGAALIDGLMGHKHLPKEVLDRVLATTDGVPLFIEELTKATLESGIMREDSGEYFLDKPLPTLTVPPTLRDSLMERLDRLGGAKIVAQVGAAIGRSFSFALLSSVINEDETVLRSELERLAESRLINIREERGAALYVFKHALVREIAYDSLLRSRRVALHIRIVEALERLFPQTVEDEPEVLAQHAGLALLTAKALGYWLAAGRQAIARSANLEAISRLSSGLSLIGAPESGQKYPQLELDLQLALGQASIAARGYTAPSTKSAFARAEQLAEAVDNRDRLYPALYGIFVGHLIGGDIRKAGTSIKRLHQIAATDGDRTHLSLAYRLLGSLSFFRGDVRPAEEQLRSCLQLCGPEERKRLTLRFGPDTMTAAEIFLALTLGLAGKPDAAIAAAEAAVKHAKELGHALTIAQIMSLAAQLRYMIRDYPALDAISREGTEYCDKNGIVYFGAICRFHKIRADAETVGAAACWAEFQRELDSYRAINGLEVGYFRTMLAEMLLAAGETEAAAEQARAGIEQIVSSEEGWWLAEAYRVLGDVQLALPGNNEQAAESSFAKAKEQASRQGAKMLELRAAVSLAKLRSRRSDPAWAASLRTIYDQFPEGLNSDDMRAARQLLETMRTGAH
jgi:class 3 adenylate cyclase/predicted ATPase/ABC-type transport system involved in cytochrome c biogenesis ATPase subunit